MSTSQVNRELGIDDDDMGGEGEGEGAPDHGEWLEKAEAHQAATANAGAGAGAKSMMPPPVALQQSESGLTVAFGALGKSTTPPPRAAGGASRKPRLMLLMVLLTSFAIAAAAAQDEPATLAAIVQQMSSLQQRVALVETENADLRLELAEVRGGRQGPPNAHFAVSSLGQSRQLGESPETCCRWTPGQTCQTTEEVCTMMHEYIEGKALTVEFLDAENAQCLGSSKDAWSASFDGSTAKVTLSNAAGVVTTTPTPLKVTHAVNCTAELPTLTLQLPTVVASTLLVGGYDVAAAFAKLGATLANASESPPPSSPPSPPYGTTTTLAGSGTQGFLDGDGTSAQLDSPSGVAIAPSGAFALVADRNNHRIRRVDIATGEATTLAGSGAEGFLDDVGTSAQFTYPSGVAIDPSGAFALVADMWNHCIRRVDIATGEATTLAGSGSAGFLDDVGTSAQFGRPFGVAIDPSGAFALVADMWNHRIRRVDIATGEATTLAGSGTQGFLDGDGTSAHFYKPFGVAIDPSGAFALAADTWNHRIRRINIATGEATTLAGSGTQGFLDGDGTSAQFNKPSGVAIDPSGAFALVADYDHHRIRRVDIATGETTTLAGSGSAGSLDDVGTSAQFYTPKGVAIDPSGAFALVADSLNHRIRRVDIAT